MFGYTMFTTRVQCDHQLVQRSKSIGLMEGQICRAQGDQKKFEITQIMLLLICTNGNESPGFRFWNFARGSTLVYYGISRQ